MNPKQRAFIQNNACLFFPSFICGFMHSKQDFSIRITSLYGSQPSFVAFACKRATLGPELQIFMGPRPHVWFFAFKTANLAPELQVSMGPCPHLLFWHAKRRLYDENYNSRWVPALICGFCMQNSDFLIRIASVHGS